MSECPTLAAPPPSQFADDGFAFALLCSVVKELSPGVYGLAKLAKPFEDLLYQLTRPLVNGSSDAIAVSAASALASLASDSHAKGREAHTAVRKVAQVRGLFGRRHQCVRTGCIETRCPHVQTLTKRISALAAAAVGRTGGVSERKRSDDDGDEDLDGAAEASSGGPGNSAALVVALRRMRALASAVDVTSVCDDVGGASGTLPAALDSIMQVGWQVSLCSRCAPVFTCHF